MTDQRLELLGMPQGNFTRGVRIALAEKEVAYDHNPLQPHTPEVCAIHPWGKVPALRHGDVTLGESRAIVGYLDRIYPQAPAIPGDSPEAVAEVDQWISLVSTVVDNLLIRRYALSYIFPKGPGGGVDQDLIASLVPEMRSLFQILDRALEARDFIAGDRFSFADGLLIATLEVTATLPEGKMLVGEAANVGRYLELHGQRPSVVATRPW